MKMCKFKKDSIHTFHFKNSYSEEIHTVILNRENKGSWTIQHIADLKQAYRAALKIKENKPN